jgi:hypothetical protein
MSEAPADLLWPDDSVLAGSSAIVVSDGPNTELAVILLSAGCTQSYIRQACGFDTLRAVQAFCRDAEVRKAAAEQSGQRARRIGDRALVSLERLLARDHQDLRAHVLAIRTGLEVSQYLKRDISAPTKRVEELSVAELSELIAATKAELDARSNRPRAVEKVSAPALSVDPMTCND